MMRATNHLREKLKNLPNKIKKHEFCIYSFLGLAVVSLSFYFLGQIKGAAKLIEKDKEIIELNTAIQEYHTMFWEQQEFVKGHHKDMYEAEEAMKNQNRFIQDIILYLKKIGHWPPKVTPEELRKSKGSEA